MDGSLQVFLDGLRGRLSPECAAEAEEIFANGCGSADELIARLKGLATRVSVARIPAGGPRPFDEMALVRQWSTADAGVTASCWLLRG